MKTHATSPVPVPNLAWRAALLIIASGCASGGSGTGLSLFGPKGSPWTIRCMELTGPHRVERIEQIADTLKRTPGVRADDVFIRDGSDGYARLYYGTYYRRRDPDTGKHTMPDRLREDLDLLKQLGAGERRFFLQAIPVRMPTPDVGDPQWDLRHVDAEYSLQVGVFEPNDQFLEYKKAAVEFCRLLRERGFEAYYYHTPAASHVTVGAFGPEAVVVGSDGRTYYSREVQRLQQHELLAHNLLNGGIVKVKDPQGNSVPVPSRLVRVPQQPSRPAGSVAGPAQRD